MKALLKATAAKVLGVSIVAAGGVAVAAVPAHAATQWQMEDTNHDGRHDVARWDADGNGYAEVVWLDLDFDGRWDTQFRNTRGSDAYLEWITVDLNENSRPEVAFYDYDQWLGYEWMYLDINQDGAWDAPGAVSTGSTVAVGGTNPILAQSLSLDYSGLLALAPGFAYGCGGYYATQPCM